MWVLNVASRLKAVAHQLAAAFADDEQEPALTASTTTDHNGSRPRALYSRGFLSAHYNASLFLAVLPPGLAVCELFGYPPSCSRGRG